MPKPTLRGHKPANRELQPELYLNRPKGRGFRPSYDEMREALIATRGRYGLASIRLQCCRTIVARLGPSRFEPGRARRKASDPAYR